MAFLEGVRDFLVSQGLERAPAVVGPSAEGIFTLQVAARDQVRAVATNVVTTFKGIEEEALRGYVTRSTTGDQFIQALAAAAQEELRAPLGALSTAAIKGRPWTLEQAEELRVAFLMLPAAERPRVSMELARLQEAVKRHRANDSEGLARASVELIKLGRSILERGSS